jgi:hypothetical protein
MIPHFNLTDAERASAAWDAYLCQNLMARFTQAQELGQERAQFDALWANRPDISLGENEGFWVGRDSVYNAWVQSREDTRQADRNLLQAVDQNVTELGAGSLERVNLMSPLIEVARNGETAKGMWYCPGVTTQSEIDGKMHLSWHYIRYGVDFIKEDADWKLWHVFVGSEFQFEMGHAYIPATGMKPLPDATVYVQDPRCQDLPLGRTCKPDYDLSMHLYGIDYGWSPYPMVPVAYETFEETFSYGPEPFLTAGKEDSHEQ